MCGYLYLARPQQWAPWNTPVRTFFSWLGLEAMARGASGAMALSMQFLAQSRPAQVLVACVELQPRAATCRVRPWGVQEINWAQGHHSRMEAARQKQYRWHAFELDSMFVL